MTKSLWINGLIIAAAVVSGVAVSAKPWQVFKEQRLLADQQIAEAEKSEERREQLIRQEARLRSAIGKEELARSRGWIPADEVAAPK